MSFFGFFRRIGVLVKKALGLVEELVSEQTLALAVVWVRVAAGKFLDNAKRREFVVEILMARGVPESVARLAVELAVRIVKQDLPR